MGEDLTLYEALDEQPTQAGPQYEPLDMADEGLQSPQEVEQAEGQLMAISAQAQREAPAPDDYVSQVEELKQIAEETRSTAE